LTVLLVTTIRRHTPFTEPSGYIYLVDLEKQQVLQRSLMIEPAFREVDTNPRGGMRGSRGIAVREDQIAIANASMIFRYDPQWNLLGMITHPAMAAIHDIAFQGNTLWATAARTDLVFQFDFSGKLLQYFYMRNPCSALRALYWQPPILLNTEHLLQGKIDFRDPRTHREETYDRAHVNSICFAGAGGSASNSEVLVSMGLVIGAKFASLMRVKSWLLKRGIWPRLLAVNRWARDLLGMKKNVHSDLVVQPAKGLSAVVRLSPTGDHRLVLALENVTVPSHSLLVLKDQTMIFLNTTAGEMIHFEPEDGQILSTTKVTNGFLRGVIQIDESRLLMGSKTELITFDLRSLSVESKMAITQDINEAVYDIKILPAHYAYPPQSFEQNFEQAVGFKSEDLIAHGYNLPVDVIRKAHR
jgi:hypothetical protein